MDIHTWVTAYDMFSARMAQEANVDTILVGDSLGMTVYGMENTTTLTKEIMLPHCLAVKKTADTTRIVVDFPFGSTEDIMMAVETAEFFSNHGFNTFKIEGGIEMLPIFMELRSRGYEIIGHLGLTPQSITNWKLQGTDDESAEKIFTAIQKFSVLGIKEIVLECVPESVGQKAQEIFSGRIIGIGAGRNLGGQVLVFDDIVGRTPQNFRPKFLKRYTDTEKISLEALKKYKAEVEGKIFPGEENIYE